MRRLLSRRQATKALTGIAAAAAVGVSPHGFLRAQVHRPVGRRAIILGGGFAGAAAAAELRRVGPGFETLLIDPADDFFSQPASIDVVFGRRTVADATRSYAPLVQAGVEVVKAKATGIDADNRLVNTDVGAFAYDALILATGVRLMSEKIEGLIAAKDANISLYDRAQLPELKRRIDALGAGTAIVSVPGGAIKCPPAPYEFALQLAERIKGMGTKGKVILLDAWPTPQPAPVASALAQAFGAHAEALEYIGPVNVQRVDAAARRVYTSEGDVFPYDLLSLIPPHGVHDFVANLRLAAEGDIFVDVDPITQRARESDTIYAVGDVARVPFGKTAAAAVGAARLCARSVARALGAAAVLDPSADRATVETVCYPQPASDKALSLITNFSLTPAKDAPPNLDIHTSADTVAGSAHLENRRKWEAETVRGIFGA